MLVWGIVALVIVASITSGYQHFLLQRTGTAIVYSSRRKLIARILHLPIREFDSRRTGDLVSRVGTDTTLLYAVLTQGLADAVGNSIVFVGALIAMALIDPALLGLIVLVIGASIVIVTLLSGRIRTATRDQQERVGELASGVERAVGSIRTVRAAGASDREEAAIAGLAEDAYDQGVRIAKVSALVVPIAGIALQLSLLVVLGVGGLPRRRGRHHGRRPRDLRHVPLPAHRAARLVLRRHHLRQPGARRAGAHSGGARPADRDAGRRRDRHLGSRAGRTAGSGCRGHALAAIEFRDVHFRYPEAVVAARRKAESEALAVLENAHVDRLVAEEFARRGRWSRRRSGSTARCCAASRSRCRAARASRSSGPSGAGKSTTLALIERFYDPTEGAVLLDGADVRTLDRVALRAQLGYVEQDAPTLAGTIAENLRLASPDGIR